MKIRTVLIGTRNSQLALWQTTLVEKALNTRSVPFNFAIVPLVSEGDKPENQTQALHEIGGVGLFTRNIEKSLLAGEIDLAVHSLKDLPTKQPELLIIGAILARANPFDALVCRQKACSLDTLPQGVNIGTSSTRRAAQLKAYRPDLNIIPIRGNVGTRLAKTQDPGGLYDASLLAVAGLERLGITGIIDQILKPPLMLPAPGQGAIAVQARADDSELLAALALIDHAETRARVTAERAFLARLEAGCHLPVSAYATLQGDKLHLMGRVNDPNSAQAITLEAEISYQVNVKSEVNAAAQLGIDLADQALAQGAGTWLDQFRTDQT